MAPRDFQLSQAAAASPAPRGFLHDSTCSSRRRTILCGHRPAMVVASRWCRRQANCNAIPGVESRSMGARDGEPAVASPGDLVAVTAPASSDLTTAVAATSWHRFHAVEHGQRHAIVLTSADNAALEEQRMSVRGAARGQERPRRSRTSPSSRWTPQARPDAKSPSAFPRARCCPRATAVRWRSPSRRGRSAGSGRPVAERARTVQPASDCRVTTGARIDELFALDALAAEPRRHVRPLHCVAEGQRLSAPAKAAPCPTNRSRCSGSTKPATR